MSNQTTIDNSKIPEYVTRVTQTLNNAGFEVFLVGGCVRDLIIDKNPKDWDATTNANPEEIIKLFEKTVYENDFGTVGVCIPKDNVSYETINDSLLEIRIMQESQPLADSSVTHETKYNIVEVTPYRIESKYTDFRHPDKVIFSDKLEDDLKRRDFTMNSLALDFKGHLIDLYKGQEDIKDKVIRAVGIPNERFQEDALRMLRAVRFSVQLDFAVSYETMQSIIANAPLIKNVSFERIRDEFVKIIESDNPSTGIAMLSKLGLLKYIIPELEEGIGCIQGGAHIYDVFEHCLQALDHAANKGFKTEVRLAALFHDIGKPKSRRENKIAKGRKSDLEWSGPSSSLVRGPSKSDFLPEAINGKKKYTFYGHEVIGERMVKKIMERLKFPKKTSELVVTLVRNHMFFSDTETITLSAVRRIIQKVGKENIWKLMEIRECDRVGMKKAEAPYRLRKYHAMIEEVLHDPISVSQLKINGETLIKELHMKPGPRMGWILNILLEEVLDDPKKNTKEYLIKRVKELNELDEKDLKVLGEKGKEKKEQKEQEEVKKLHKKHGV